MSFEALYALHAEVDVTAGDQNAIRNGVEATFAHSIGSLPVQSVELLLELKSLGVDLSELLVEVDSSKLTGGVESPADDPMRPE